MILIKNKLMPNQIKFLPQVIKEFALESNMRFSLDKYILTTIQTIRQGIERKEFHDIWISGNIDVYCLAKPELDCDGELVYTAYQLWIKPKLRNQHLYKKLIKFLRFYAQKHQMKRLYIVSSRLDKIQAYQRGIGYSFKPVYLTFVENYN